MAATSVLKLQIDDREYEASLKNAKAGMQDLQQSLQAAGKTFYDVDGKVVEYARAIGKMDAVSKTAKGRIGEMSQAFIELKSQYINMTDAEKQSPIGQAMAQSLEELKGRTIEAKQQLADLNKELEVNSGDAKESSGILDQLASKFTINVDAIKLFNLGLKAANAALNVAKDAFFASEANVDEWGRTMQAAESLYAGFVTSLNNGDFSGFLSNIDGIVKAAREAYNELDRLGTMKTIQGPAMSKQEAENQRMRTMLMTGRWISAADGRRSKNGLKDGDLLSPAQLKVIERQLQNGMQTIVGLTKNEVQQTGKAIDAYYNSLAKQNGMSRSEFRQGTSSWDEFSRRMQGYEDYKQWDAQARAEFARQGGRGYVDFDKNNPYAEYRKWGTFRVDKMGENSYNDLVGLIRQQQQQQSQMYSTMGQAYRTINRAEGVTVKGIMNPGGGGGKSHEKTKKELTDIQQSQQKINELTKEYVKLCGESTDENEKRKEAIRSEIDGLEKQMGLIKLREEQAKGKFLLRPEDVNLKNNGGLYNPMAEDNWKSSHGISLKLTLDDKAMEAVTGQIEEGLENRNTKQDTWSDAKRIVSGLNQVSSGLQQMGVELPEGVQTLFNMVNGLMTVIEGVNTITGGALFSALTANTFALGALTQAIWTNTATSLIPFARGGIVPHAANGYYVPGDNFSGDTTPILANAGELVLNKAAQGNLASQLSGNNFGGANLVARLRGRDILISVERTLQSKGKGQLVTFK